MSKPSEGSVKQTLFSMTALDSSSLKDSEKKWRVLEHPGSTVMKEKKTKAFVKTLNLADFEAKFESCIFYRLSSVV